ncbi:uncharacterized protein A4U43_C04F23500 [Asparagus officinalis]|uniref:Uncharacterized protein n=1 Tax=Asparagus officinalis TaxID=4686 RepID=A0A5P1F4Z9_ASPOF|nr:uncharacterized protein A4U43_C04F23500 [Asparagus officinalis]
MHNACSRRGEGLTAVDSSAGLRGVVLSLRLAMGSCQWWRKRKWTSQPLGSDVERGRAGDEGLGGRAENEATREGAGEIDGGQAVCWSFEGRIRGGEALRGSAGAYAGARRLMGWLGGRQRRVLVSRWAEEVGVMRERERLREMMKREKIRERERD